MKTHRGHDRRWIIPASLVLLSLGCRHEPPAQIDLNPANSATESTPDRPETVQELYDQGRYKQALLLAQESLIETPDDAIALRMIAGIHAQEGRFNEAADIAHHLSELPVTDPALDLLQAYDWHLRGGSLVAAEADARLAVQRFPDDLRARRVLAELLNSFGCRYEASQSVHTLLKQGGASHRELLSVIDLASPFELVRIGDVAGNTANSLLDLGKARYQLVADSDLDQALETLETLRKSHPENSAIAAFRGRLLVQKGDFLEVEQWLISCASETRSHPEYWSAFGNWLIHKGRDREAVRAFADSLRLDPTDRLTLRVLAETLEKLGDESAAMTARATLGTLGEIFFNASRPSAQQAFSIAEQLQSLVRPWESLGWYELGAELNGSSAALASRIEQRKKQIVAWENNGTQDLIRDARLQAMTGLDLDVYPELSFDFPDASTSSAVADQFDMLVADLRFRDVSKSVGIDERYISDYSLTEPNFFLHQANGGGIAVTDFDLDGRVDLYFAQSGGDPLLAESSTANQLYRQSTERRFESVDAGVGDQGFGQGVCSGDLNQDGFADLLVGNIGSNSVYINQGDGTFRKTDWPGMTGVKNWTSSVASADLDGDGLPEIIEVNYLDDPAIFRNPCLGPRLDCTPQRYRAAADRIFRNRGDGTYAVWSEFVAEPSYGFGVVIANFDDQLGNDMFVSNDGMPNHFWKSTAAESGPALQLTESAGASGCDVGINGVSQACMGLTSFDADRSGTLDLAVTNFYDEPSNLLLQNRFGTFSDAASKLKLAAPTTGMLGFGMQADDFNNDGWPDLAILNGHIYDARYADIPFKMAPQLFRGSATGFVQQDPKKAGVYWSTKQLGRTMVKLDFNQDGKIDLISNHLDLPFAVLENQSEAKNWIQFELVGVSCERDAIGAKITIRAGAESWTGWVTGGDGYMCTNEPVIHIGIGEITTIDEAKISWPLGQTQSVKNIPANHRYLVTEGHQVHKR